MAMPTWLSRNATVDQTGRGRLAAVLVLLVTTLFLTTGPVSATGECATAQQFWAALSSGVNPLPAVIPGPMTGWVPTGVEYHTVTDDGESMAWSNSTDNGFRAYYVPGMPAGRTAGIWGKPMQPAGRIDAETGAFQFVSQQGPGGLVCISVSGVSSHPTLPPPLNDTVEIDWLFNPPAGTDECGLDDGLFHLCGVGTAVFCQMGSDAAFNKMFGIMQKTILDFYEQTDAQYGSWGTLYAYCHVASDGYDHTLTGCTAIVDDFDSNSPWAPASPATLMHLFSEYVSGGCGACPGQWTAGGYDESMTTASTTEENIFLHEIGHNFDAAHETNDGGFCADGAGHADRTSNDATRYTIMYNAADDDHKVRDFSDGGNVNYDSARDNLCFVNVEIAEKVGGDGGSCV